MAGRPSAAKSLSQCIALLTGVRLRNAGGCLAVRSGAGRTGSPRDAQVAEWLMAADCKSAAPWSYGGSNPPLCTRSLRWRECGASAGKARAKREVCERVKPQRRRGSKPCAKLDQWPACGSKAESARLWRSPELRFWRPWPGRRWIQAEFGCWSSCCWVDLRFASC